MSSASQPDDPLAAGTVHPSSDGFKPFDEGKGTKIFRINPPHRRQEDSTYFVTWRMADSLPNEKLDQLSRDQESWLRAHGLNSRGEVETLPEDRRHDYHRLFTAAIHHWLDAGYGSCSLRRADCAQVVAGALRHFDGERYLLDDFVVMPNHVHVLVCPLPTWELSSILHSWKGFSSHLINRILQRSGAFWQQESWDHIVRSEAQLNHYRHYIRDNPQKACLREGEFILGRGTHREE